MRTRIRIVAGTLILIFCALGCDYTSSQFERHGFKKDIFVPEHPILFVPGLGYTGKYWEKSKAVKQLQKLGWVYGGELKIRDENGKLYINPEKIKSAHLYTLTFSSHQLPIVIQGKELAEAIRRVKEANHDDRVILVGHSMGGLAAREYLQSPYYKNDVAGYISLGTPHQGSNFNLEKIDPKIVPKVLRNLLWRVDVHGESVRDMRPKSIFLSGGNELQSPDEYANKDVNVNNFVGDNIKGLNDFKIRPLPADVYYSAVIGSGCPVVSTRSQCQLSDGIVRFDSQDLNQVPGVNIQCKVLKTDKDHFGEADDSWVLIQALKILMCPLSQNPKSQS